MATLNDATRFWGRFWAYIFLGEFIAIVLAAGIGVAAVYVTELFCSIAGVWNETSAKEGAASAGGIFAILAMIGFSIAAVVLAVVATED